MQVLKRGKKQSPKRVSWGLFPFRGFGQPGTEGTCATDPWLGTKLMGRQEPAGFDTGREELPAWDLGNPSSPCTPRAL